MKQAKERAGRNRTIRLAPGQEGEYLGRCLDAKCMAGAESLTDRVIWGDCLAALPLLPRGSVDLLIADPPYNLDKVFGESVFHKMGPTAYKGFTRDWIQAALPALKGDASVYVCCDWRTSLIVGDALSEFFVVQNRITWQREKGRGAARNWKNGMEDIWFATVSKRYTFHLEAVKQRRRVIAPYRVGGRPKGWEETERGNFRDTCPSNFWDDISVPYWSMPENTDHPAQKPEKLFAKLILASSDPGGLVLDPFAGAGTSCVAAKKLGRRFLGVEIEPEYCALAAKRLEMAELDPSIQGYANGVFWERNSYAEQKRPPRLPD